MDGFGLGLIGFGWSLTKLITAARLETIDLMYKWLGINLKSGNCGLYLASPLEKPICNLKVGKCLAEFEIPPLSCWDGFKILPVLSNYGFPKSQYNCLDQNIFDMYCIRIVHVQTNVQR